MSAASSVSVVICTHGDRQGPLARLISTLAWQTYPFELIVVAGAPSPELRRLVGLYAARARVTEIRALNISRARNEGIRLASGDIIVFVDDDAVPADDTWLERLTAPFREAGATDRLAAVGSTVLRADTEAAEYAGGFTSRSGFQRFGYEAAPGRAPDGTDWIPRVPGGNCALDRRALQAICGFDEQYAYYLDETDLCVRLVAAGYRITHVHDAPIRHFPAHSVHGPAGQRHRFPVARSDAYFAVRHVPGPQWRRVWGTIRSHPSKHFVIEGRTMRQRGELSFGALARFRFHCWRGLASGVWAALTTGPLLAGDSAFPGRQPPLRFAQRWRVLLLDSGSSAGSGTEAPPRLAAWAAALQRDMPGTAVAVASSRVLPDDALPARCVNLSVNAEPPVVGDQWTPDGESWGEASRWVTALGRHPLTQRVDALLWPGPARTGALIAEALGCPVLLVSVPGTARREDARADDWISSLSSLLVNAGGARIESAQDLERALLRLDTRPPAVRREPPPGLFLFAELFERKLTDEASGGSPASVLSDPVAGEAALAVVRQCLWNGRPDLAVGVGTALRSRLADDDRAASEVEYHLATACRALGRGGDAEVLHESVRSRGLRGGGRADFLGGACFHLGKAAEQRGHLDRAARLFEECLAWLPDHAAARRGLEAVRAAAAE